MPILLSYAINTFPNMLIASTSAAELVLLATNNGNTAVSIQGISLSIPVGTDDDELTDYPSQIKNSIPAGWNVTTNSAKESISFIFTPVSSPASVAAGSSLTFTLSNINVNANDGTVNLTITEGSTGNPTESKPVSKFPAGWGVVNFWTVPSNLQAPGAVVLHWSGPSQATYTIQYMNPQTGQIYNLPAPGDAPFGNSGAYPGSSDPALIINVTTMFTLTVTATIGGKIYETQVSLPVQVYVPPPPPPAINSFSGSMGTASNGGQVLNLVWTSENDDHVEGDWTPDPMDSNVYASAPWPVYPPFKSSYSIFAVTEKQRSAPKTLNFEWQVLTQIAVGSLPQSIVVIPDGSKAFVTNSSSDNVSVIDTIQKQLIKNIPLGTNPLNLAVTPNGQYVLVGNSENTAISIIEVKSLAIVNTIALSEGVSNIAITPGSDYAVIGVDNVYLVNIQTGNVQAIDVGAGNNSIWSVAITKDGNYALATYYDSRSTSENGEVAVIDLQKKQFIKNIPVGPGSTGIGLTPDGQFAYIVSPGYSSITVIDLQQLAVIKTIDLQENYWLSRIEISSDGRYALAMTDGQFFNFSVINIKDPSTPVFSFDTDGQQPNFILISPDSTTGFISTSNLTEIETPPGYVWVYNFNKAAVEATVQVGSSALSMAITPDSQMLFVINQNDNNVSVLERRISS